jgi:hypothetical protein
VAADRGWQREFDDPIELPDGRVLVTLLDAATHITELPKREPPNRSGRLRLSSGLSPAAE